MTGYANFSPGRKRPATAQKPLSRRERGLE
jgi:hypothetical protein